MSKEHEPWIEEVFISHEHFIGPDPKKLPAAKAALVQIHADVLAQMFELPPGAHIDAVFQSREDVACDCFTFRVFGAGSEVVPGCNIRYASLEELQGK